MERKEDDTKRIRDEKYDEQINLRELILKYLYHWPVFIVGVLICISAAFFYLRYAQEVFEVNSTLLIKDEKKGGATGAGDLLNDLDLFGTSKVVDNEIEILKSKTLMRKVVDRLNLSIDYHIEGRVSQSDAYASKPIDIGVVEMDKKWDNKPLLLSLSADTYTLEDPESGEYVKGRLGQLQRNKFGVYKIDYNRNFTKWQLNPKTLSITIHRPEDIVKRNLDRLNITLSSKQSTVLDLRFETTSPERGRNILNTLIQVYNEAALTDKNRTTQSTMAFIDERLKLISAELTDVEKDVEGFKSSLGLTDISNEATLFLDNVKANDAKLNEINLQISVIQDIQRYVNSRSPQEKLPSTLGINDPVLLGQITQLSNLQLERDALLATTGSNNPTVAPLNNQIETTRAGIKANVENIYESLNNTKRGLEGNESQIQASIKKIPGQERQLISIERQKSIKESLYLYLLQKKEEAALSYASAVADSRIVDPAFSSQLPIKPKRQVVYLIALLFGLILPVVYIYIKDLLNNKVSSASDISKITNTPLLGEIMYDDDSEAIVVQANSRKAIAEQFRAIRTNMQFLQGKSIPGKGRVMLITSSMSGEGKSFVSTNIAAALAISGKKTVLLELDLRKPKVSKYLDLNNKTGLSNYLIGKAQISDIIFPTEVNPNLYVIGSGPVPPNPSELLVQTEIEVLLDYLKSSFDEILIDTPPIGLVTDAQILARLADATIYLVRQNVTFKNQIESLEQLYRQKKFPKLNVILNGIKLGGSYGYGYGYGYYSDDIKNNRSGFATLIKDILKRF